MEYIYPLKYQYETTNKDMYSFKKMGETMNTCHEILPGIVSEKVKTSHFSG
ncbi:hypothetical protein BROSI_A3577 [Candidatus Brocadia sinica JPN1]|uniref:Uncharacterized protein n=1 Tax=Candidatus Brocadia sinica JPN1 TaxID=1197129 RepID=A0ABQ0K241_9BACT|nr:hypothetical protein BROSI_A3577 [Candidatus Brocadia sinica JPN1]